MKRMLGVMGLAALLASGTARADDPQRKACLADARRLCRPEMKSLSRKRVELCLARRVAETTPPCHAMIDRVRAERTRKAGK